MIQLVGAKRNSNTCQAPVRSPEHQN